MMSNTKDGRKKRPPHEEGGAREGDAHYDREAEGHVMAAREPYPSLGAVLDAFSQLLASFQMIRADYAGEARCGI